jgi:hypothetical protein
MQHLQKPGEGDRDNQEVKALMSYRGCNDAEASAFVGAQHAAPHSATQLITEDDRLSQCTLKSRLVIAREITFS